MPSLAVFCCLRDRSARVGGDMSLLAAATTPGVRPLASSSSVLLDANYHPAGSHVDMGKYCHAGCCPSDRRRRTAKSIIQRIRPFVHTEPTSTNIQRNTSCMSCDRFIPTAGILRDKKKHVKEHIRRCSDSLMQHEAHRFNSSSLWRPHGRRVILTRAYLI